MDFVNGYMCSENGHVTGKVLVYKSPGLHFGDTHIMTAKYVQELDHIGGYAIFFSTKGPRSTANEIVSSDFDGDMYWVSVNPPQLLNYYKVSEPLESCLCNAKSIL